MKSLFLKLFIVITFVIAGNLGVQDAAAQYVDSYYDYSGGYPVTGGPDYYYPPVVDNTADINQLLQIIAQLQAQINAIVQGQSYNQPVNYNYGNYGFYDTSNNGSSSYNSNDNEPDVETESARDIKDDSAELRGEVDMNDFNNGIVFFVYGQDEDMIEDVESDYDEYRDVNDDEEDDDFEVVKVDSDLDNDDSYEEEVSGLEEDEEYFFIICVEYEDEDNDETLECGDVEDFETDN